MAIFSQPSLEITSRTRASALGIALLKHRKIITSATKCMLVEMPPNTSMFGDSQDKSLTMDQFDILRGKCVTVLLKRLTLHTFPLASMLRPP